MFGSAFAAGASFVDIRGVAHDGSAEIGAGHQGIFDTIYKGSVVHIEMETARMLTDDIVLARGSLDAGGPEWADGRHDPGPEQHRPRADRRRLAGGLIPQHGGHGLT